MRTDRQRDRARDGKRVGVDENVDAEALGQVLEDEDWLGVVASEMEIEDGVI